MKKEILIKCIHAVTEYVTEALKREIKEQVELVTNWNNDENLCNTKVALSHLESILEFEWRINNEEDSNKELKHCIKMILYDEPYYKFNIPEIIRDAYWEIDATEYNAYLIMYLMGKISIFETEEED